MTTTAQSLMDKAYGALQATQEGETVSGDKQTLALSILNAMIDRWSAERLSIPQILQQQHTLSAGDGDYTVATGGDIAIARPLRVVGSSFIRDGTQDYPLRQLTREQYNDIGDKSTQSIPRALFYDGAYPTAKLYLWPVPDKAYTLLLDYWAPIGAFATAATSADLPPAAEAALWQNLAVELWPFYPTQSVYQPLVRMAMLSKAVFQRANVSVPILEGTFGAGRYDVTSDTWV